MLSNELTYVQTVHLCHLRNVLLLQRPRPPLGSEERDDGRIQFGGQDFNDWLQAKETALKKV